MQRVNHSVEYMSEEGACSNQAESFFARFRRFQQGQINRMGQLYISNYAKKLLTEKIQEDYLMVIFSEIYQKNV